MSGPSILIVEDDTNLRLTLTDNLQDEGYQVHGAASAKEAQAMLASRTMRCG